MTVGAGVTEIADSEEEPLTSSPAAIGDVAADKLSTTLRQDVQAVASPHQDFAERIANDLSSRTGGLDVDHEQPSTDPETFHIENSDLLSEQTNRSTCTRNDEQADLSRSQVDFNASEIKLQSRDIGTHCERSKRSTSQDACSLSAHGSRETLQERACTPTDGKSNINGADSDHQQSGFVQSSPVAPTGSDADQSNCPGGTLRLEKPDSHTAPSDDNIVLGVQKRHAVHHTILTIEPSQVSEIELDHRALAEDPPKPDTGGEFLIALPISTQPGSPKKADDTRDVVTHTSGFSDSANHGLLSAAANAALPSEGVAQNEEVTAKTNSHDDIATIEVVWPEQATCSATATPPSAAKVTAGISNHKFDHTNDSSDDTAADVSTSARSEMYVERPHGKDSNRNISIGQAALPEDTNVDRDPYILENTKSEVDTTHPRSTEAIVGRPLQPAATYSTETVPPSQQHRAGHDDPQKLASASPVKQSQSSALYISEPALTLPVPQLSPQEIALAELKAQKNALLASLKDLPAIQVLIEESQTLNVDVSDDDGEPTDADVTAAANKIVKEHIKLLHEYNELKDVGQGLMGLIADQRGVRIVEVQDEFGIDAND